MIRTLMNNYVLRVYRFDRRKPQTLVGLVEEVETRKKKAFTTVQELWDILSHPKANSEKGKKA